MDTYSMFIGLGIALLFFLPIIYIIINGSSSERKTLKRMKSFGNGQQLTFSNLEIIGNVALGLDAEKKQLLFNNNVSNKKSDFKLVDLTQLQNCEISVRNAKPNEIECIQLDVDNPKEHHELLLYNEREEDTPFIDAKVCLHRAQEWQKMVNKLKVS
ncbi:hypothetical protein [Luteirhabdus pelagi]|uniref:hypothetical protein n=1 Tax=Luteirhabdus pelagi TaxID=2792783 RepID=UPI00193A9B91|nr:hypothetical protein [Luteirhabdus pelagi]